MYKILKQIMIIKSLRSRIKTNGHGNSTKTTEQVTDEDEDEVKDDVFSLNQPLISSWMQFWIVSDISKYFNVAKFQSIY